MQDSVKLCKTGQMHIGPEEMLALALNAIPGAEVYVKESHEHPTWGTDTFDDMRPYSATMTVGWWVLDYKGPEHQQNFDMLQEAIKQYMESVPPGNWLKMDVVSEAPKVRLEPECCEHCGQDIQPDGRGAKYSTEICVARLVDPKKEHMPDIAFIYSQKNL